jgi:hypothetical protein
MLDKAVLQTGYTSPLLRSSGRIAVVVLMLGLWLGLVGLSASEQLHQLVHSDSHHVNHECLLTLFAKGHLSHSTAPPEMAVTTFACFDLPPLVNCAFVSMADIRLAQGRAPPADSSLHQ